MHRYEQLYPVMTGGPLLLEQANQAQLSSRLALPATPPSLPATLLQGLGYSISVAAFFW